MLLFQYYNLVFNIIYGAVSSLHGGCNDCRVSESFFISILPSKAIVALRSCTNLRFYRRRGRQGKRFAPPASVFNSDPRSSTKNTHQQHVKAGTLGYISSVWSYHGFFEHSGGSGAYLQRGLIYRTHSQYSFQGLMFKNTILF